ncbi:hypothetical protein PEX1_068390 [Penicillium expansum]|nr:hypothetical protein PEX1_068390 [Penicillium expansum]
MAPNIATVLNDCLKEFTESTNSGALTRYENEVSKHRWLDELGQLRVWAGNIGAHQTGQSSLDYRLRDASHLKDETVKLLQRLLRLLRDLADVIEDENQVEDENDAIFFEDSELELEDNDMTDIQMLFQSLRNTINLLFQMSMAIRRPADHDRLLGVKIKDESYFELWAQKHISHKFPNAKNSIIPRLSAAMARQKAVLKYFARHRAKLGKGLSNDGDTGTQLSETVATEVVLAEDHLQFLETNSTSGISETSYAPSIFTSNESLSFPNPPKKSADENPFECPYCCLVIKIKGKKDWARHVFRDLMPYVCISSECSTPSKLYESRRKWYDHMCQSHSLLADLQSGSNCPLCQVPLHPPMTFDRHVGHHMEQLALFVLPRTTSSEEASSGTASNATFLAAFGDESTPSTALAKGLSQIVDETNLHDESSYLEGWPSDIDYVPPGAMAPKLPPSSFSQIKGTPDSFSVFSWAKSWEKNFGTCQHFPQRAVGNANPEGLGHSPNSKSQAHENFPWESGEKANEYSSHSFGIDGDTRDQESTILGASNTWTTHAEHLNVTSNEDPHDGMLVNLLSLNAFDGRQVKLPGTTSHGNDQTDDLEGGSSSLDGKKKAW